MTKLSALFWFEPYWSHHAGSLPKRLSWLIPRRVLARCGLVAAVAWITGAGLLWAIFPAHRMAIPVAGGVALLMFTVILFVSLFYSIALPKIYWFVPPFIYIDKKRLQVLDLVGGVNIEHGQPGIGIRLDEIVPGRRVLIITWPGGVRRIGLKPSVDLQKLESLTCVTVEKG